MCDIHQLMEVLQLYERGLDDTRELEQVSHDEAVKSVNYFLFHHGPRFGVSSWADVTQGLRDNGVDGVWHYSSGKKNEKLGVQVKSASDFRQADSFRRSVMAQIAESRQYGLSRLLLCLSADMTSSSSREKARGILADVERMTDDYVFPLSAEKMAGIFRWRRGLNVEPLQQMQEAGYAWLTAVYDSYGNVNHNSFGKETGGDWSQPNRCTIYVGDIVTLKAVAQSQGDRPLNYCFSLQPSGQSFSVRQPWSDVDTWTWKVEQTDIGRHVVIMIAVRAEKGYSQFGDADDYTYAIYDVLPTKAA